MGTRTYSRRRADGTRVPTALGLRTGKFNQTGVVSEESSAQVMNADVDKFASDPLFSKRFSSEYPEQARRISNASEEEIDALWQRQMQLPVIPPSENPNAERINPQIIQAIALYAPTPELRNRAIQFVEDTSDFMNPYSRYFGRELQFIRQASPDAWMQKGEEEFMTNFWEAWRGERFLPVTVWAQIQQYFADVGINQQYDSPLDFYPNGIKPPQLNPKITATLQKYYAETQRALERMGYPEEGVTMYRGTTQPAGLGLESWTDLPEIGELFAGKVRFSGGRGNVGEVRQRQIPRNAIFGSWQTIKTWDEDLVTGKQEYIVLGTALAPAKRAPATSRVNREDMYNRIREGERTDAMNYLNI